VQPRGVRRRPLRPGLAAATDSRLAPMTPRTRNLVVTGVLVVLVVLVVIGAIVG
jgi:hypothetical protein